MKVFGTIISCNSEEQTLLEGLSHHQRHRQIRVVVAAKSMAEAIRKFGLTSTGRDYTGETGNEREIEIAMSKPGQVFAKTINDYSATPKFIEIERQPHVAMKRRKRSEYTEPKVYTEFTRAEIEYLRDIMEGANNPVAAEIGIKAAKMLTESEY